MVYLMVGNIDFWEFVQTSVDVQIEYDLFTCANVFFGHLRRTELTLNFLSCFVALRQMSRSENFATSVLNHPLSVSLGLLCTNQ